MSGGGGRQYLEDSFGLHPTEFISAPGLIVNRPLTYNKVLKRLLGIDVCKISDQKIPCISRKALEALLGWQRYREFGHLWSSSEILNKVGFVVIHSF